MIRLLQGDCLELLPGLADGSADMILTDPPYSEKTHTGMRSLQVDGSAISTVNFDPTDAETLRIVFSECARICRRWLVSFIDWRHAILLEESPPDGLEFVRLGVWVKGNGMPQLTGDRPGTGWEAIAFLHNLNSKKTWNGGSRHSVFEHLTVRAGRFVANFHPAEKPVGLVGQMIELFTEKSDVILDPYMGSGTTGVACVKLGRSFIGIEKDPQYFEIARKRIEQAQQQTMLPL